MPRPDETLLTVPHLCRRWPTFVLWYLGIYYLPHGPHPDYTLPREPQFSPKRPTFDLGYFGPHLLFYTWATSASHPFCQGPEELQRWHITAWSGPHLDATAVTNKNKTRIDKSVINIWSHSSHKSTGGETNGDNQELPCMTGVRSWLVKPFNYTLHNYTIIICRYIEIRKICQTNSSILRSSKGRDTKKLFTCLVYLKRQRINPTEKNPHHSYVCVREDSTSERLPRSLRCDRSVHSYSEDRRTSFKPDS